MVVAGTEAGDVMIIELHPLPKTLTTFGKSSGMYVAMTVRSFVATVCVY